MNDIKIIEGGVCAAKGFTAGGVHCGIRKNRDKRDLAMIVSDRRAAAAAGRAKYHRLFDARRVVRYLAEAALGEAFSEPYEWAQEVYR